MKGHSLGGLFYDTAEAKRLGVESGYLLGRLRKMCTSHPDILDFRDNTVFARSNDDKVPEDGDVAAALYRFIKDEGGQTNKKKNQFD